MTPQEFDAIKDRLGLSYVALAKWLDLSSDRVVRRYKDGDRPIPGPVRVAMRLFDEGHIPNHMRKPNPQA